MSISFESEIRAASAVGERPLDIEVRKHWDRSGSVSEERGYVRPVNMLKLSYKKVWALTRDRC